MEEVHMGLPLVEGQEVPNVNLTIRVDGEFVQLNTKEQFANKRVILFAFPSIHTNMFNTTIAYFEEKFAEFQEKGIDEIYCISVNDSFVMNAWFESQNITNVFPLPDGNGEFTHKIGAECKKSNLGFGYRSWRYALVINDGKVEKMFIEEGFGDNVESDPYEVSTPENVAKYIVMNEYFRYTLKDLEENSAQKKFNYITFFAGGGGSSCAYKLEGGDCRYMNEFQQLHVDTYLQNFPNTIHECKDIKEVTGKGIMELSGLEVGEIDILDASPPCPPFSMAGSKREGWNKEKIAYGMKQTNIEDLTWEVIRITGELKPKVVICENVKGLTMDYAKDHLIRMIQDFEAEGYSAVYKVMKGQEHGVPQKRERTFILAVRNDVLDKIGMPWMVLGSVFPEPSEKEWTVRDAIEDLQDDEENIVDATYLEEAMRTSSKSHWVFGFETHPDFPNSGPCLGMRGINDRDRVISIGDDIVGPWFKTQIKNGIIDPEDEKHSYYMSRIVPWNQAAHSLTEQGCQPKFMGGNHFHPSGERIYTPKELQRIMTLPDDYKSTGDYNDKGARIGLMVAPLCLRTLVESVNTNILEKYNVD